MSLSIEGVSKSFGSVVALDHLSLEVREGEIFGLVGHTGSGKTTLLRIIAGLDKPDEGRVLIDGSPREKLPFGAKLIQMVFQNYALWPNMTVLENLSFPLTQRKMKEREIVERVEDIADRLGIDKKLFRRYPHELSEGQKQMVAVGRSLVAYPKILLLDEAFAHMDPITKLKVRNEIMKLQEELRMTILLVTHQLNDAIAISDRIGVMRDGRMVQIADPEELMESPINEYVEAYIRSYRLLPERRRRRYGT